MSEKHSCPFQGGTFLKKELLTSKAFISLSKNSKTVLLLMYLKCVKSGGKRRNRSHYEIVNNGDLQLTYPELRDLGLQNKAITRAFDELIEKGFIKVEYLGGNGKKDPNLYSVIDDWKEFGSVKFKPRKRQQSIKHGYCKTKTL